MDIARLRRRKYRLFWNYHYYPQYCVFFVVVSQYLINFIYFAKSKTKSILPLLISFQSCCIVEYHENHHWWLNITVITLSKILLNQSHLSIPFRLQSILTFLYVAGGSSSRHLKKNFDLIIGSNYLGSLLVSSIFLKAEVV